MKVGVTFECFPNQSSGRQRRREMDESITKLEWDDGNCRRSIDVEQIDRGQSNQPSE